MKFLIQRVKQAQVDIAKETVGKIGQGLLVLIGIGKDDSRETAERLVKKTLSLRIFADADGKTNLSLRDVGGSLLLVSQFTLYADCHKGNRPTFNNAGNAELAKSLYEYTIELCKKENVPVETGRFGADMAVSLLNDGPFTLLLE
ncbi:MULTISPECIES: D-aminoacyl-tRNA deacylase [Fibrobacter]|uniref:D-aminoacyl-tRNA deacylase n=1 Tax=Fibrobacter intestinalis TaxID=28122 RepID=A0A1M6PZ85_9BACT|nr:MULTISPECIES: D-aminoacyl-tRNA deacylase [Fibrobacter]MDD7297917.1 D-aminoacyl-tRNA deacylase [Fibrobacter intestinalis]PBC68878.1 D-tyrosyl-tRNA(Tyr) deacylase [Fibrobacter sp. UWS1]PBC74121.1 D-tyrosyl-tRNA(Tyr) deacylase [Fibrobacter sp. NR9]SHK13259.1 D-tyrosyl-tRNA(Tyr) deacylase [Fibrobacter intestinalis]SJZ32667.1 D-tyrosyl-tRNA(Tyr) deacylase [Fibrobacter intestinalis]